MSGKIGPKQPKVTHGHHLPDSLNPAKHPEGKLKNDPEAGPSQREESIGSNRSSTGSGGFDEIVGLLGGGRFKTWEDFRKSQALSKAERFDLELDKNAYVNAHLNPDLPSPDHAKTNWTKRPDFDHPMHADYVIAQNAEYYTFRKPEQHSGPLTLPSQSSATEDHQVDPRSTQSTPSGSPRKAVTVDPTLFHPGPTPHGTGEPDHAQATHPQKGTFLGSLSTTQKVALGGAATLMLGGMITAAVVVPGDSSSGAQGEAQA